MLYPHQRDGAEWLAGRARAALLDDPGLGKTITAIVAADIVKARRVLVLAPSCVVFNWRHEFEEWSPGRVVQVVVTGRTTLDPKADVIVTTHGLLLTKHVRAQLLAGGFDLAILDESHFLRSPDAKRAQQFYGIGGAGVVDAVERVWCLTGTPMPNNCAELWTMLHGLWRDRVPESYHEFRARYCRTKWTPYGDHVGIVGNLNVGELRQRIEGLTLRRRKDAVLDLPPVRYEQVNLRATKMPQEIAALEAELGPTVKAALAQVDSVAEAFETLGNSKAFAAFRRLCGLAKADAAADLLEMELDSGALPKVVVFAHHSDVVERVAIRLARFGVRTITGATSALQRRAAVLAFQSNAGNRVIVCNILAGGTGTTLTAAADVVFVEMSYVPGENAQAADRIRRIGQKQACRVRFIALDETLDASMVGVLRRKTAAIREVFSD